MQGGFDKQGKTEGHTAWLTACQAGIGNAIAAEYFLYNRQLGCRTCQDECTWHILVTDALGNAFNLLAGIQGMGQVCMGDRTLFMPLRQYLFQLLHQSVIEVILCKPWQDAGIRAGFDGSQVIFKMGDGAFLA